MGQTIPLGDKTKVTLTIGGGISIVLALVWGVSRYNQIDTAVQTHSAQIQALTDTHAADIKTLATKLEAEQSQATEKEVRTRLLEEAVKGMSSDLKDIKADVKTLAAARVRMARGGP